MLYGQQMRVFTPTGISGATNASVWLDVDTLGWNHASFLMVGSTSPTNNTDKVAAFSIYEHDTTTTSTANLILAGTTNTTAATNQFIINAHTSSTILNKLKADVDLRGRMRWLYFGALVPANTNMTQAYQVCVLTRPSIGPDTTTEANVHSWGALAGVQAISY